MAKIGTADIASRYSGVVGGPRFAFLFETQSTVPVDGTNASLRDVSPFTIRFVPPDALIQAAATASGVDSVDLLDQAAKGSDTGGVANAVSNALQNVSAIGDMSSSYFTSLNQFVANGEFYSNTKAVSTITDALQAADIAIQLSAQMNAEPLVLLVNPTEMTTTCTKIQNYGSRTRFGYVFEAWGEEQPSISFSGTTAGFVCGSGTGQADTVSGYQGASKRDSAAWQNFMSLYQFYRNNGYIYDTMGKSEAHLFIGAIAIDYDQFTYVGNIESFSYTFDSESPLKVTWQMEFKVSRMYDRHMASSTVSPLSQAGGTADTVSFSGASSTRATSSTTDVAQTPFDIIGIR